MEYQIEMVLSHMKQYALENNIPIVSDEGAGILIDTVKKKRPARILEIGTAIGYSTLLMAANAPEATVTTIEIDQDRHDCAVRFLSGAGVWERTQIIKGDAAAVLPSLQGPFDFVYIDAAKGQYLDYLKKILGKLTDGALIATDNVLFRGWVLEDLNCPRRYRTIVRRLREYLQFVGNTELFETTIYKNGDGMAITYFRGVRYE